MSNLSLRSDETRATPLHGKAAVVEPTRERFPDLSSAMVHGKYLLITAQTAATLIYLSIFLSSWGNPRMMWLSASMWIGGTAFNVLSPIMIHYVGHRRGQTIRSAFNLAAHIPLCVLCQWSTPSWLFMPFFIVMSAMPPARFIWQRVVIQLTAFNGTALLTDGRWQDMLVFSALSLFFYFTANSYLYLVSNLVRERDRNLHELKEAHHRVLIQEKMASIGQIAAGVAHEINNPMCFVTANIETLLEDLKLEPELPPALVEFRDEVLPDTIDGIRRVNSIVGDLRRFARGEPEHFEPFDLTAEISAAVRMARTQMKPGQELDIQVPPRIDMNGSPRQLCQVVLNLIMNGLQALPVRGKVTLSATTADGAVEVAVRDNGTGMTEETRRRLFEPFFTTKAREGAGLGLGLSVVYGIVKAHGGTIEVESTLGRGSCFRMHLPCSTGSAAASVPAAGAAPA